MSKTHWKRLKNPDYIGAYALDEGKDLIVTIKNIRNEMVTNTDGKKEECIVAHFAENGIKPMILNSTNMKTIQKIYNTPYIEEWSGRKVQLYAKKIKAFGEIVEALRVRDFIPKDKQEQVITKCTDCGKNISSYEKMTSQQMASYTYEKYGKPLCSDCATKIAAKSMKTEDVLNENDQDKD